MSEITTSVVVDETVIDPAAAAAQTNAAVAEIAKLIVDTHDSATIRKRSYTIGKRMLAELFKRKKSIGDKWQSNGNDDFGHLAGQIKTEVRMISTLKDPRADDYLRYHFLVEQAKQVVGETKAENLPYGVAVNLLFPAMFSLDKVALTADLKKGWDGTFSDIIMSMASDRPMGKRDIEHTIETKKAEIKKAASSRLTDEQQLEQERKAKRAELTKAENKAREMIVKGIDTALGDNLLNPAELLGLIEKVTTQRGVSLPATSPNQFAESMTEATAREFAAALMAAKNVAAARALHKVLGLMLQSIGDATTVAA